MRILLLAMICCFITIPVMATDQPKSLSVSGFGEVYATPDEFHFSLFVEDKGDSVAQLNQANTKKAVAIVEFLRQSGVDKNNIQSMNVNLNPKYQHTKEGRFQDGFILSRKITVILKDLTTFDTIIDGVMERGVSNISGFSYQFSDPQQHRVKAMELAMIDVQAQASRIAKGMGVELGDVMRIDENGRLQFPSSPPVAMRMMSEDASASLPGQVSTSATLNVVYEIK